VFAEDANGRQREAGCVANAPPVLTPSLLAMAFRGELVPQNPADEPAAELLKRLAVNRTAPTATIPKARQGQLA